MEVQEKRDKQAYVHNRITCLDGIRAIGALFVVFCHLACAFVPELYNVGINPICDKIWNNSPLNIITSAHTAVQMFFVISGFFVVMKTYTATKEKVVFKQIAHRILRLLEVIVPAIVLSYIIMRCGLFYNEQVAELDSRFAFVSSYVNFQPSLLSVIEDVVRTLFQGSHYVGPFWTIKYELAGSVIVLLTSRIALKIAVPLRKWIYFVFALIFMYVEINFAAFFIGAFVSDIYHNRKSDDALSCFVWKMLDRKRLYTVILILGFYCATVSVLGRGIYTPFKIFNYIHVESYRTIVRAFGVGVIVLLTLKSSVAQKIMNIRPLQFVGTYSAYIYGFHWTIILSIGCFMCMHMWKKVDFRIMMALISIVCVVVTVAVSYIYDKTYKKIRKWIDLRYRGKST